MKILLKFKTIIFIGFICTVVSILSNKTYAYSSRSVTDRFPEYCGDSGSESGVGRCFDYNDEGGLENFSAFNESYMEFKGCKTDYKSHFKFKRGGYTSHGFYWVPDTYCTKYAVSMLSIRMALDLTVGSICAGPDPIGIAMLVATAASTAVRIGLITAQGFYDKQNLTNINAAFPAAFEPDFFALTAFLEWIGIGDPIGTLMEAKNMVKNAQKAADKAAEAGEKALAEFQSALNKNDKEATEAAQKALDAAKKNAEEAADNLKDATDKLTEVEKKAKDKKKATLQCLIASAVGFAVLEAAHWAYEGVIHADAKSAIERDDFCGSGWLGWGYTKDKYEKGMQTVRDAVIIPNKSYKYMVQQCVNNNECDSELGSGTDICDYDEADTSVISPNEPICENMPAGQLTIRNKIYREYLFDGQEYPYSGCLDPRLPEDRGYVGDGTSDDKSFLEKLIELLSNTNNLIKSDLTPQRYYFRGNEKANFACDRYKVYDGRGCTYQEGNETIVYRKKKGMINNLELEAKCIKAFSDAYSCCNNAEMNYVCLQETRNKKGDLIKKNDQNGTFCLVDRETSGMRNKYLCSPSEADYHVYSIYLQDETETYACARSTGYCPYDFNLKMGSLRKYQWCNGGKITQTNCGEEWPFLANEYGKASNGMHNIKKNFCQYLSHCTVIPTQMRNPNPYSVSGINWFSPACTNFIGDSQNVLDINIFGITKNHRGITAPMAQCIKESIENIFLNRIGTSTCRAEGLELNNNGYCGGDDAVDIAYYKQSNLQTLYDRYGFEPSSAKNPLEVDYFIVAGETMPPKFNVFVRIQNALRNLIKLAAILAITVGGFKILRGGEFDFEDEKTLKDLTFKLFKFAIVMYFAIGDAWQGRFYKLLMDATQYIYVQVYDLSIPVSGQGVDEYMQLLKITSSGKEVIREYPNDCTDKVTGKITHLNKCTDGVFELQSDRYESKGNLKLLIKTRDNHDDSIPNGGAGDETVNNYLKQFSPYKIYGKKSNKYYGCYFDPNSYPAGKGYIAMFDTIDCKLARYFGFTGLQDDIVSKIIMFAVSSLFTLALGPLLFAASLLLFFIMLSFAIKVLYVFAISIIMTNVLIFLSPIVFPCLLFERTKGVFEKWYEKLSGVILQPIFLFVMMSLFVLALDKLAIGGATFSDDPEVIGPAGYELNCPLDADISDSVNNSSEQFSYLCMFTFGNKKPLVPALADLGIDISILEFGRYAGYYLFVNPLIVIISILKIVLLAFIFSKSVDKIEGIASQLFGGGGDVYQGKGTTNALEMTGKAYSGAKRASYAANSMIKSGIRKAPALAKGVARGVVGAGKVLSSAMGEGEKGSKRNKFSNALERADEKLSSDKKPKNSNINGSSGGSDKPADGGGDDKK